MRTLYFKVVKDFSLCACFKSTHLYLSFITIFVTSFGVQASDKGINSIVQYILEDIPDPIVGTIFVPSYSDIGEYRVYWDIKGTEGTYLVEEKMLGEANQGWAEVYEGGDSSTLLSKLEQGHYIYRVRKCYESVCSDPLISDVIEVNQKGLGPTNVVASKVQNSNQVTWDSAGSQVNSRSRKEAQYFNNKTSEETVYKVEASVNGGAYDTIAQSTDTKYQHTIEDNYSRQYRVKACVQGTCTNPSKPSNIVGGIEERVVSSIIELADESSLQWDSISAADYYQVYLSNNGGQRVPIATTNETFFSLENLPEGSNELWVSPCDANGCYTLSALPNSITTPVSAQCNLVYEHLSIFSRGDDFRIGHVVRDQRVTFIPGTVLTVADKSTINSQQYWHLTQQNQEWALDQLATPPETTDGYSRGGLIAHCAFDEVVDESYVHFFNQQNSELEFILGYVFDAENGLISVSVKDDEQSAIDVTESGFNEFNVAWPDFGENYDYSIEKELISGEWEAVTCEVEQLIIDSKNLNNCLITLDTDTPIEQETIVKLRLRVCELNECTLYPFPSLLTIQPLPTVFKTDDNNLYIALGDEYIHISLVKSLWQVTLISSIDWENSIAGFEESSYVLVLGDFNSDGLEDFRLQLASGSTDFEATRIGDGYSLKSYIRNIIFIHTDLLGTPVAETGREGGID